MDKRSFFRYSSVHRVSVIDDREFWCWIFHHWDIPTAIKLLDDYLEDDLVQIETVEDLIPDGYVYSRSNGLVCCSD